MLVINLNAWCGDAFNYVAGDLLDLPDAMAQARLDAGLVRLPTPLEAKGSQPIAWQSEVPPQPAANPAPIQK